MLVIVPLLGARARSQLKESSSPGHSPTWGPKWVAGDHSWEMAQSAQRASSRAVGGKTMPARSSEARTKGHTAYPAEWAHLLHSGWAVGHE